MASTRHELDLDLPRDPAAGAFARRRLREQLGSVLGARRVSELVIIVTELVTNAVEHGRGAIRLRLRVDAGAVTGEVIDDGGGFEHEVRARGARDISGRGLLIVEALTSGWGIHEGTTHVWFEMPLVGPAPGLTEPRLGPHDGPTASTTSPPPTEHGPTASAA